MADSTVSAETFAPHCGLHEHVVFSGKLKDAEEYVCVCLEPGLHYGFRFGAPAKTPRVSFSIDGLRVRGDFDWTRIGGADWTFLAMSHDGTTYTIWVRRPDTDDDLPAGRLEIKASKDIAFEFEPASIIHDLPFK